MSLLGELHDLDGDPFMLGAQRRDVRKENLGVDVAPELLDLDRLLPEIEDVDRILQQLHDTQHQLLERASVHSRDLASSEGKLNYVVVEGGGLLGEALGRLGASLDGLLAELLVALGERLPVVAMVLDELLEFLAQPEVPPENWTV